MSRDTPCTITLGKQRSRLDKHNSNDSMRYIEQMTTNLERRNIEKIG